MCESAWFIQVWQMCRKNRGWIVGKCDENEKIRLLSLRKKEHLSHLVLITWFHQINNRIMAHLSHRKKLSTVCLISKQLMWIKTYYVDKLSTGTDKYRVIFYHLISYPQVLLWSYKVIHRLDLNKWCILTTYVNILWITYQVVLGCYVYVIHSPSSD